MICLISKVETFMSRAYRPLTKSSHAILFLVKSSKYNRDKPIFFSSIVYGKALPVFKNSKQEVSIYEVIMITSIADNRNFKGENGSK